jgi:hypothetical protein
MKHTFFWFFHRTIAGFPMSILSTFIAPLLFSCSRFVTSFEPVLPLSSSGSSQWWWQQLETHVQFRPHTFVNHVWDRGTVCCPKSVNVVVLMHKGSHFSTWTNLNECQSMWAWLPCHVPLPTSASMKRPLIRGD